MKLPHSTHSSPSSSPSLAVLLTVASTLLAPALGLAMDARQAQPRHQQQQQQQRSAVQERSQDFYVTLSIDRATAGYMAGYDGWQLQAYHTGAGLADPVFVPPSHPPAKTYMPTFDYGSPSRAFVNGTYLQFDVGDFPFAATASSGDTNYARWEPVTIAAGYGGGDFVVDSQRGLITNQQEFDGWLVCEWFHGGNLPQLFQLIKGFDDVSSLGMVRGKWPSSCVEAKLTTVYI